MYAPIVELQSGAGHQILDRAAHEHFTRLRLPRHARTDMHGDSANLVPDALALPRVQPGTDGNTQGRHGITESARTTDRARGAVKRREETVTCRIDLAP